MPRQFAREADTLPAKPTLCAREHTVCAREGTVYAREDTVCVREVTVCTREVAVCALGWTLYAQGLTLYARWEAVGAQGRSVGDYEWGGNGTLGKPMTRIKRIFCLWQNKEFFLPHRTQRFCAELHGEILRERGECFFTAEKEEKTEKGIMSFTSAGSVQATLRMTSYELAVWREGEMIKEIC